MPAVQFLIDHVGLHSLFFVKLTNLYSISSEHKAREDNVITLLLPWSVDKSQMCKYFLSTPKNSLSAERWSEHERQAQMCKYFLTTPKNYPSAERWSEHFRFERRAEFRRIIKIL